MKIEFLSTIAVITPDPRASRKLFVDALGLPLEGRGDEEYQRSEQIAGCKHFGVWPLSQAAEACFGNTQWPAERPVPQVSIEFDVADAAAVSEAAQELLSGRSWMQARGRFECGTGLHSARRSSASSSAHSP